LIADARSTRINVPNALLLCPVQFCSLATLASLGLVEPPWVLSVCMARLLPELPLFLELRDGHLRPSILALSGIMFFDQL
jgi:hypothetical protein